MKRMVCMVLMACIAAGAAGAAGLDNCNVELELKHAASHDGEARNRLTLELAIRDGKFLPDFVWGRGQGQGRHVGVITSSQITGDKAALELDLTVKRDLWMRGGKGHYKIEFALDPDAGRLSGKHEGKFTVMQRPAPNIRRKRRERPKAVRPDVPPELQKILAVARSKPKETGTKSGVMRDVFELAKLDVNGTVSGRVIDPWPENVEGHAPVQPGEHPRLIFRKADLPELKRRAATPEGKAIMKRLLEVLDYKAHDTSFKFDSWPGIGLGFAYQMTGERKYADRARDLIKAKFFDRGAYGGQDIHHGPQAQGLALTFDLCYDGWDEEFRTRCVDELWTRARECATGTFHGRGMGGMNLAYWSNHNGIRQAGAGLAALAVLYEKTSDGTILGDEALAIADEAAWDQRGWVRDGCGGGSWCMEGMFYKWMTMVRGLAHYFRAYRLVRGWEINAGSLGDSLVVGHFLEAAPGSLLDSRMGIDSDSLVEMIWTMGFAMVPEDVKPGVKYLMDRSVGLQGNGTFGLERAPYAAYLMSLYPFETEAKHPSECFPWVSPDPVNGHWVFRPTWKDKNDILMTWNMLSHPRGSCHYERVGPVLHWRLRGFGQTWMSGRYQPTVKGKESALVEATVGTRFVDWEPGDRTAIITFDVDPGYMPLIPRARGDTRSMAEKARSVGGFRAVRQTYGGYHADHGVRARRHVAVDCSGVSGAPLLLALVDDIGVAASPEAEPEPAEFTWRLPLDGGGGELAAEELTFKLTKGEATLSGVLLGGEPLDPKTASARVTGGRSLAVLTLQPGPAPAVKIQGEGISATVTVGKRNVRFDGKRLRLE